MSITAIPSSTFNQQPTSTAMKALQQDFTQIGQDLSSGNLTAAQQDFTILQQNLPSADKSAPSSFHLHHHLTGSPPRAILNQLGQFLSSGNLSAAQAAYASLQALAPFSNAASQPASSSPGTQAAPVSFDV